MVVPAAPVAVDAEAPSLLPPSVGAADVVPVVALGLVPKPNRPPDGVASVVPGVVPVVLEAAAAAVVPWGSAGLGGRPKRLADGAVGAILLPEQVQIRRTEYERTSGSSGGAR